MYERPQEQEENNVQKMSSFLGGVGSFLFESIEAIVVALALCVVLYLFLITPHEVVGSSMFPTYINGEYLIANKIVYKFKEPSRGDVIIFKHTNEQDLIKRIIGLPGDTVAIVDGIVHLNGSQLDESEYLDSSVYTNGGSSLKDNGDSFKVPAGHYFTMGDNRPGSSDSREFGPIELDQIKAKSWVVYFPFEDLRYITTPDY